MKITQLRIARTWGTNSIECWDQARRAVVVGHPAGSAGLVKAACRWVNSGNESTLSGLRADFPELTFDHAHAHRH